MHTKSKIGFGTQDSTSKQDDLDFETIKERIMEKVSHQMSPELLNRLDYKIVFRPLNKEVLTTIFKIKL
jgi:ATP-dependent Clp protease ATP-binding subunit ClpA